MSNDKNKWLERIVRDNADICTAYKETVAITTCFMFDPMVTVSN